MRDLSATPQIDPGQLPPALETALTLGAKGVFGFADLSLHPAIATDTDIGEVMLTRYIEPVLNITGGDTVLATTERYLGNDRNIEITAKDLEVHPNHRPPAARPLRGGHRPLTSRNRDARRGLVGARPASPRLTSRFSPPAPPTPTH